MLIEFAGPSTQDADNPQADPGRLFNLYRQPLSDTRKAVKSHLGMTLHVDTGGAMCRAMEEIEGDLYAVVGGKLYTITSGGTATELGDIPDSAETTLAGNNGKVCICADGRFFVWDGTTLSEPVTGAFANFGSVDFLAQRTLLTEKGGRRYQWSNVIDPTTLDGLNFATTESRDDNNIRGMVFGPEYWIFKERSIERIYPNAAAASDSGAFASIPGATIDKGLAAFNLLCRIDTGGFFVATDGKAYLVAAGGAIQRVSTPPLETAIAQGDLRACYSYQDEGHEFCVIAFGDRPAWLFDVTTGEWSERGEGVYGPWLARRAAKAYGAAFVGNDTGQIIKLERTNADLGQPMRRIAVSRVTGAEGARFRIARMQVNFRTGVTGTAMLRTSRDRGMTWSAPKERSIGAVGEYRTQVAWRALGQFRDFVCEVSFSDGVEAPFESVAALEVA